MTDTPFGSLKPIDAVASGSRLTCRYAADRALVSVVVDDAGQATLLSGDLRLAKADGCGFLELSPTRLCAWSHDLEPDRLRALLPGRQDAVLEAVLEDMREAVREVPLAFANGDKALLDETLFAIARCLMRKVDYRGAVVYASGRWRRRDGTTEKPELKTRCLQIEAGAVTAMRALLDWCRPVGRELRCSARQAVVGRIENEIGLYPHAPPATAHERAALISGIVRNMDAMSAPAPVRNAVLKVLK